MVGTIEEHGAENKNKSDDKCVYMFVCVWEQKSPNDQNRTGDQLISEDTENGINHYSQSLYQLSYARVQSRCRSPTPHTSTLQAGARLTVRLTPMRPLMCHIKCLDHLVLHDIILVNYERCKRQDQFIIVPQQQGEQVRLVAVQWPSACVFCVLYCI